MANTDYFIIVEKYGSVEVDTKLFQSKEEEVISWKRQ